jgi:hypothetical protein
MIICSICKKEKSESEFYKNRGMSGGFDYKCEDCDKKRDYRRRRGFSLHKKCIDKLGGKCKRCGIDDWRVLQIDHVNGGGKKEIQSYHKNYDWRTYYRNVIADNSGKYQVLCANCNWIKRWENKEGTR